MVLSSPLSEVRFCCMAFSAFLRALELYDSHSSDDLIQTLLPRGEPCPSLLEGVYSNLCTGEVFFGPYYLPCRHRAPTSHQKFLLHFTSTKKLILVFFFFSVGICLSSKFICIEPRSSYSLLDTDPVMLLIFFPSSLIPLSSLPPISKYPWVTHPREFVFS